MTDKCAWLMATFYPFIVFLFLFYCWLLLLPVLSLVVISS